MSMKFLKWLADMTNFVLPAMKEKRPLLYWHAKTCLKQVSEHNDFCAARDLVEAHLQFLEEQISSAMARGDLKVVEHNNEIYRSIVEGAMGGAK
jgi:hypothetical protein